jgi:hypothetical protein
LVEGVFLLGIVEWRSPSTTAFGGGPLPVNGEDL